jgi:hypothetical protein
MAKTKSQPHYLNRLMESPVLIRFQTVVTTILQEPQDQVEYVQQPAHSEHQLNTPYYYILSLITEFGFCNHFYP